MEVSFNIHNPHVIAVKGIGQSSDSGISELLFECTGTTLLKFGNVVLEDKLEVIIRLSEIIRGIDLCISESTRDGYFTFQFENRIKFSRKLDSVCFFDREANGAMLEKCTIEELIRVRSLVVHDIGEKVSLYSRYVGDAIVSGDII